MTEKQHSYGIIPLRNGERGIEVLVVRQTQLGRTYWSFPKGTPEGAETPIETARREVQEEVGLVFGDIAEAETFSEQYTFTRDGKQIEKTTTYFVGHAKSQEYILQEEEIEAAEWLPLEGVSNRLTYDETEKLFVDVRTYLEQLQ